MNIWGLKNKIKRINIRIAEIKKDKHPDRRKIQKLREGVKNHKIKIEKIKAERNRRKK